MAYNMNNQHTAPSRMDQVDRCRLAEARAYIAEGDREAQVNRLDLYTTEYLHLKKSKDFATLEAMFAKVLPVLSGVRRRWSEDAGMYNRVAWAYHEYALVLHERGKDGALGDIKAFAEAEAVLGHYPDLAKENAGFRRTQAWLYHKWAVELWNQEDWEGALTRFERQRELSTLSDRKSVLDNMTNAYLRVRGRRE